jgi:catabolite regulation protein CreA
MKNITKLFLLFACITLTGCDDSNPVVSKDIDVTSIYRQSSVVVDKFVDENTGKYCYVIRTARGVATTEWIDLNKDNRNDALISPPN